MSSSAAVTRGRVMRGPDAAAVAGAALDADLSVRRVALAMRAGDAAPAELRETLQLAREEAARVGYEDGYQAGLRAGAEEAQQRLAPAEARIVQAAAALGAAAEQLGDRQQVAVADVERCVARLAVDIAEAVLGRDVAARDDLVSSTIVRALALAPADVDAVVRLHPEDAAAVADTQILDGTRGVSIVADATVEPGGCVVDAGPCRIDAQIGPALARVRKALDA